MKILLIDNYDSFTFNLYHYLSSLNADVEIFRNDQITEKEIIKLENKIITHNEKLKSVLDKLNNKAFIEKAPDDVIENFKIQEQQIKSSIEKINEIMNTIN